MKNKTLLLLLLAALTLPVLATAQIKRCQTFESQQDFKSKNPDAETDAQFEGWLSKKMGETSPGQRLLSSYTIPVIFHVVHNGEAVGTGTNISADKIQQQLDQLNRDFANASGSVYSVAASANIQFRLAVIDPQGRKLTEPGIERINRQEKSWTAPPYNISNYNSYADVTIMPASIWNPYAYFNVWVIDIAAPILGKATFPSLSSLNDLGSGSGETDTHAGVLLDYATIGSVAQPGPYGTVAGLGRTLTHETGHFFGLRHIWGDATCGDDYCNDTPVQDQQTEECPTGELANNCTTPAFKMYENYMDYTFDACVNTFTADQVTRMQTVMLNSPRRKELAHAGTYMAPAENSIRFANVSFSFSENGTNSSGCPAYRQVEVPLNLFESATGAATLHFTNTGTAQAGVDYELLTPTLTFQTGDVSKTLQLRIFDDAAAESAENIELQYTISGAGAQPGGENQILLIHISDNDGVTGVSSDGIVTLLKEDFDGNGGSSSTTWTKLYFGTQDRINQWTVSSNGNTGFTNQTAHITNNSTTKANTYNINSMANIGYMTGPINAKGLSNISLAFKYKCEGELFNGKPYDYGTLFYSLDGKSFQILPNHLDDNYSFVFVDTPKPAQFSQTLGPLFDNQVFYIGFLWNNDNADGIGSGLMIDDVELTGESLSVGQVVGEMGKQMVPMGEAVLLKNASSSKLVAKVENAASHLGCVTATILQSGNGRVNISTQNGAYLRTQKVVQITPGQPAKATVTLYFTTAELEQWGNAKGALKILKVADGVSLDGILTNTDAELITPDVVTEYAAEGYVAYTCTVSSFSQFMLVSPAFTLPVRLVQFNAKPVDKHIALSWLTADEKENKGFWMERSTNSKDFQVIGWMGSNTTFQYTFNDVMVQPGSVYYYRLKQVDNNGKTAYSDVRQAKLESAGISLQVAPNPVQNVLQIWIKGSNGLASLQLLDANGRTVGVWNGVQALYAPLQLPVGHLPKGIYTLRLVLPEGVYNQKVLKQ
jgi:hypothetical protein